MQNRIDGYATLENSFDNLKRKVVIDQAGLADVEMLLQKIMDLIIDVSKEQSTSIIKSIRELSKNYTILLPFLMKIYKEISQNQEQYVDHENLKDGLQNPEVFKTYLRMALIQPMLLKQAEVTQQFFTSKYFGKIPIISIGESVIYTPSELSEVDLFLEKNMNFKTEYEWKDISGSFSSLQPYALTFNHLNKLSEQLYTPTTNKTFFNYLVESSNSRQSISNGIEMLKLIFADSDVVNMFLPSSFLNRQTAHGYGMTLKDEKIILISIDKKNLIKKILKSIIHEIQHFLNTYFVNLDNDSCSKDLSDAAISKFIKFIDTIKFDEFKSEIVKDLQNILENISQYEKEDRNLDELSAHLTFLLFRYSDVYIREVINIIFSKIAEMSHEKVNCDDEILLVCKALSNAFYYIESTLYHLTCGLRNFKANLTKEFLDDFKNETDFDDVRSCITKIINDSLEHSSWRNILNNYFEVEYANKYIILVASNYSPKYSLYELVKKGNDCMVKACLQFSSATINDVDKAGYSLISYAVMNNHLTTFNLLLKFGASLKWEGSIHNVKNSTMLHLAAYYGRFEFIPILLNNGNSANALDEKKSSPLLLLAKVIASQSNQVSFKNDLEKNYDLYNSSIKAIAYLLSYSNDQNIKANNDPGNIFYNSLIKFRKNIALLHILYNNGILNLSGVKLPTEIIQNIALQFHDNAPHEVYKNCYRDICELLLINKTLFNQFINLGMRSAYNDYNMVIQNSANPLNIIKNKLLELIPLDTLLNSDKQDSLSESEKSQLYHYYSPRNMLMGAKSLSAVILAQKQVRANTVKPFFQNDRYNERRSAINAWKKKVNNKDDEGLSLALVQACNEIGIGEIDEQIYRKLSAILNKLVITENKTPANYTPTLFLQEFKKIYDESVQTSTDKFNMS